MMVTKQENMDFNNSSTHKRVDVSVIVYVIAFLWAFIILYPLFVTLMCSFKTNNEIFGKMFSLPTQWVWQNYVDALVDAKMGRALFNSLYIAALSTLITIVLGSMASYVLARQKYKFITPIYLLFIVGVMLPVHATIIPINRIATYIGGSNSHWFLILVYTAFQLPQAVFLITGFMKSISHELDEAATIDGCSMIGVLFRIIIPVSMPIISTAAILAFIFAYGELIFSVILLSDISKFTVPRALFYFTGLHTVRMGPVFASIVVGALPMVIIYTFLNQRIQAGMVAGAIKG